MTSHAVMSTDVIDQWRSSQRSDSYAATYVESRCKAVERLARVSRTTPTELTADDIRAYFDSRGLSKGTRRCYLSAVRTFFTWLNGNLPSTQQLTDPTTQIRWPKIPRRKSRAIDEAQRKQLLAVLKDSNPRVYAAAVLALYGGLRACEIASIHREHIVEDPFGDGAIINIVGGKGDKDATVVADRIVLEALEGLAASGPLFGVKPNTMTQMFARTARRHGIDCTLHQLRHWFITHTWRTSRDPFNTRKQARHEKLDTTEGYIAEEKEAARDAASRLPGASRHTFTADTPTAPTLAELGKRLAADETEFLLHCAQREAAYAQLKQQLTLIQAALNLKPAGSTASP